MSRRRRPSPEAEASRRALAERARLLDELKLILPENLPEATVTLGLDKNAIELLAQPVQAQAARIKGGLKSGEARRAKSSNVAPPRRIAKTTDPALVEAVRRALEGAPQGGNRALYAHLRQKSKPLRGLRARQLEPLVGAARKTF